MGASDIERLRNIESRLKGKKLSVKTKLLKLFHVLSVVTVQDLMMATVQLVPSYSLDLQVLVRLN